LRKYPPAVVRSYASALLETIPEDRAGDMIEVLRAIASAFEDEQFTDAIFNPTTGARQKADLLKDVVDMADGEFPQLKRLIDIVVEKGREAIMYDLSRIFESLAYNKARISKAYVLTAAEMNNDQKNALKKLLEKKLHRPVEMETNVEKSLLGGVRVFADDQELDLSAQGQLERLSKQMISEER